MKMPLSSSMRGSAFGAPAGTNCGRNAKKKIVSFGFKILSNTAEVITLRALGAGRSVSASGMASAPLSRTVFHAMYSR